ncbi:MAG TPA: tRNA modification GTPase [Gemmataceae bacterium]|nr:tRNA modification GTPase [Gemmataceae bacterium]
MTLTASTAPHPDETIVAVSSAAGPAARAIVRVSGPRARAVVASVFAASGGRQPPGDSSATRGLTPPARQILPGSLTLSGVHSPLPAELYFFAGPHSYTGQDVAELHTVGSPPLVERLVADLLNAGARPAKPGEFTLRAFLAGKMDLPRAEAVHAVIEAGTDADLSHALSQLAGGVTQPLNALRDDLLNLLADVEAALDFADEDIEFVAKPETLTRLAGAVAQLTNLQRQLDTRTVSGRHVRVALVGLPNAGKSSLFNALAGGPTALVSDEAGTTRDYLTKRLDVGGVPVELIDTAGWADATTTIEHQAQELGREQAAHADVILWCVEPGGRFDPADESRLKATGAAVLKVATKCDVAIRTDGVACSATAPDGTDAVRLALLESVSSLARPPLAPSQSRCRHHVEACVGLLREAHRHVLFDDPAELVALALRSALDQLGEMVGAVYTNDLLDRIFSRFCIGK